MRPARAVLAATASFVVMFLLGGLWYAVVMVDFYEKHAPANARNSQDASLLAIAAGYALLAALMTALFAERFRARPPLLSSLRFGATFGLIATLPAYLILYAIWDISLTMMVADSLWHVAQEAAGALVLAVTLFPSPSGKGPSG